MTRPRFLNPIKAWRRWLAERAHETERRLRAERAALAKDRIRAQVGPEYFDLYEEVIDELGEDVEFFCPECDAEDREAN